MRNKVTGLPFLVAECVGLDTPGSPPPFKIEPEALLSRGYVTRKTE
jgi:hypothetical protein